MSIQNVLSTLTFGLIPPEKADVPNVGAAAPVPDTLDVGKLEGDLQKAERDRLRKAAAASQRAQTTFTSSLGVPTRPSQTIKTALGGFNSGNTG